MDEITVTGHGACYFFPEICATIEGLFDRFHRKIRVSAVDNLEEGNLRIAGSPVLIVSYEGGLYLKPS